MRSFVIVPDTDGGINLEAEKVRKFCTTIKNAAIKRSIQGKRSVGNFGDKIIIGRQTRAPIAENQKENAHASLTPFRIFRVISPEIVYIKPESNAKSNDIFSIRDPYVYLR